MVHEVALAHNGTRKPIWQFTRKGCPINQNHAPVLQKSHEAPSHDGSSQDGSSQPPSSQAPSDNTNQPNPVGTGRCQHNAVRNDGFSLGTRTFVAGWIIVVARISVKITSGIVTCAIFVTLVALAALSSRPWVSAGKIVTGTRPVATVVTTYGSTHWNHA